MQTLQARLWLIDPGFFSLKQACRTVLALSITLMIVRNDSLVTQFMAGIACGFSMQGVIARSWRWRILQIIIFDIIYFSVFCIGLWARFDPRVSALVLVALAFAVNYGRRFGLDNSKAPLMAWILCFFAIIMPFGQADIWQHIYGLLVGLCISAVVRVFVLTENYQALFVKNSNHIFTTLAQTFRNTRKLLLTSTTTPLELNKNFSETKDVLQKLLASNKAMQYSVIFSKKSAEIDFILLHQYGLVNAYLMLNDACQTIWQKRTAKDHSLIFICIVVFRYMEQSLRVVKMHRDYSVSSDKSPILWSGMTKRLVLRPESDPFLVIGMLNLKLGTDLLFQHLQALIRGAHEA